MLDALRPVLSLTIVIPALFLAYVPVQSYLRQPVARLLRLKVTYQEIAEQTGASTATISRVNRCLSYGAGGYQTVLTRMEQDDQADKNDEKQEEQP